MWRASWDCWGGRAGGQQGRAGPLSTEAYHLEGETEVQKRGGLPTRFPQVYGTRHHTHAAPAEVTSWPAGPPPLCSSRSQRKKVRAHGREGPRAGIRAPRLPRTYQESCPSGPKSKCGGSPEPESRSLMTPGRRTILTSWVSWFLHPCEVTGSELEAVEFAQGRKPASAERHESQHRPKGQADPGSSLGSALLRVT